VVFDGVANAHVILRQHGIPAGNWDGVRPPEATQGASPVADRLYEDLIFLPVHQCLEEDDLWTMVKIIKRVVGEHCQS
jgi:dTDP-4-amino-4,6-dideoxygalactose transaminase